MTLIDDRIRESRERFKGPHPMFTAQDLLPLNLETVAKLEHVSGVMLEVIQSEARFRDALEVAVAKLKYLASELDSVDDGVDEIERILEGK